MPQKSPTGQPIHIFLQLRIFPLPAYFSTFFAHYRAILFSGMLEVINTQYLDKCFQMADINKGIHTTASTNMDALRSLIHTIHGTSFYGFMKYRSSINGCSRYEACKSHLHELSVISGAKDNLCTNCFAYNFALFLKYPIFDFFRLTP